MPASAKSAIPLLSPGQESEDGDLVLILHGRWNTEEFAQQVCNALAVYELFMALNERMA
jgi:hypothetical protein